MHEAKPPKLQIEEKNKIIASGSWKVESLALKGAFPAIYAALNGIKGRQDVFWDLSKITDMDYIGAQFLWDAWGSHFPNQINLTSEYRAFFDRLENAGKLELTHSDNQSFHIKSFAKGVWQNWKSHFIGWTTLTGQFILDFLVFIKKPFGGPWKEISANIYNAGTRAVGITALVGFLIGVVLSYLSAQQLHDFGGDPYLVNLLGIGITRELGPLLAAILVAGRSGSAMTAQIGVMRVTEELDAMKVMGMSHGFRLVLPKVLALSIVMPLLIMWTDIVALVGGMIAAKMAIGLSINYFIYALPKAVPLANLIIGLGKGVIFGSLIALISCHFGLRIKPNTESLGAGTTSAVVSAITIVILADAIFAIALQHIGWS